VPPEIPDDVTGAQLDRAARGRLRTLSKDNADGVARHLVMAGMLLDSDPELAYQHAQAAVRRAGRVDVVREAAGLAAYRTGRYAEALSELRTVRRLNGLSDHLAVMADCERGLGRPERAIALAASPEADRLAGVPAIELAIVVSGARLDLGETEAALAVLAAPAVRQARGLLAVRVAHARAAALMASGDESAADAELAEFDDDQLAEATGEWPGEDEEVIVFDLADDDAIQRDPGSDLAATGTTQDAAALEDPAVTDVSALEDVETHPGAASGTGPDWEPG
jgi:hypothetical protein